MRRAVYLSAIVAAAALTSACGSNAEPAVAPPGSAGNPLVAETAEEAVGARTNEAQAHDEAASTPNYEQLVEQQTERPQSRFTPCNLVTRGEAAKLLGVPLQDPLEAPQGPTCVYRSESGRTFVTIAVQSVGIEQLRSQLRRRKAVQVAGRRAYCGVQGGPTLHVPLPDRRALSVAAPCAVAGELATLAVARLND